MIAVRPWHLVLLLCIGGVSVLVAAVVALSRRR
ncbi:hypothetical protein J2S43_001842 [Catenuloplanes nepalensis]|uniref:NADH dehydrogenase subunit 6 n=1 Tax=Catenuloplanes nepalensis TaxID=587533 RepID=A0ABT9MPI0_9ACTN|nr:hypothetical protein [Catenuloplanes nepalensis]